MKHIKVTKNVLSGWSNTTYLTSKTYQPTSYEEIIEILEFASEKNLTVSILGGMKSYSDNFLNSQLSIDISKFNKIIDLHENELTVQAGATFYEVADFLNYKGFMFEVIPGTGHVTIGGAVSNNIHGKNAFKSGFFGNQVIEISYINLSNFKIENCSREMNSDIFRAIISGLGVIGIILEVKIKLKKIKLKKIKQLNVAENNLTLKNIDNLFLKINEIEKEADYLIASLNLSSSLTKSSFAKLTYSKISEEPLEKKGKQKLFKVLLNEKLVRLLFSFKLTYIFIEEIFGIQSSGLFSTKKEKIKSLNESHYLNDIYIPKYNNFFKHGFFEYQCNIPKKNALEFFNFYQSKVKKLKIKPLMTGLKSYSEAKEEFLLSFQLDEKSYGFTFDFPNIDSTKLKSFFKVLNEKVINLDGKVYYAKTACINLKEFELMYGKEKINMFLKIKNKVDPNNLLVNNLYRRIFQEEESLKNEY
jgi:hypothetical protein